jgi:restriction system protein
MPGKNKELSDHLLAAPWWVSILVGVLVFILFRVIIPAVLVGGNKPIGAMLFQWAPYLAAIFLLPVAWSAFQSLRKRKMLERQTGLASIRQLSWKEFEELLGEAFRRKGYRVRENAGSGPDGGIDLTIERKGRVYLVQCKQYRAFKVDVRMVREMLGLVTAQQAQGAIIATSGDFTREAADFAEDKPIELLDGTKLAELIALVQAHSPTRQNQASPLHPADTGGSLSTRAATRNCPECGGELVIRLAKRGPYEGSRFWGCSNYPRCHYKVNIETE